jgi:hypothetical protein
MNNMMRVKPFVFIEPLDDDDIIKEKPIKQKPDGEDDDRSAFDTSQLDG